MLNVYIGSHNNSIEPTGAAGAGAAAANPYNRTQVQYTRHIACQPKQGMKAPIAALNVCTSGLY